jgi:hypothetical protein
MYCTGCSRYLCVSKDRLKYLRNQHAIDQDDKITTIEMERYNQHKDEMQHVWIQSSCYVIAHKDAWQRYWDNINTGVNTKTTAT